MTLHILCHITFPQKGEAGQTLPGLGLAEDAGQGQGDGQAVAVLTAVVDQTQDSVELLPQPALERHPARSLLQREVVNHEAVLVAQLDAECAALPPLAAAPPHDEVAGLLEVERLGGGQPVQVRQEPDLPSRDSVHCGGAGDSTGWVRMRRSRLLTGRLELLSLLQSELSSRIPLSRMLD